MVNGVYSSQGTAPVQPPNYAAQPSNYAAQPPNYATQPPSYAAHNQIPQTSYVLHNQFKPERGIRPIRGVKYFAIITIIIAFILCILGIIAVVIEAQDSYVGDPIWTGVLFVLPTGFLGLASYWKRNSSCTNISYLVLSTITCLMCAHLVIYASINAVTEYTGCSPEPGFDYSFWYHNNWEECAYDSSGRISVDALIALFSFIQFVLCIITMGFTCYGMCKCCYDCCHSTPPARVQYQVQSGACQLVSVGGCQMPISYQPVSPMYPGGQGVQMMQQTVPVMAHPQMMQSYPMAVSNTAAPQIVVAPGQGSFLNQSATENAPLSPSNNQDPDNPPSYGQTASDHFLAEKNLLDT